MGFFQTLKNKVGGVLGKVWNGVKTVGGKILGIVPKAAGVLGTIGNVTKIPLFNTAATVLNAASKVPKVISGVYNGIKSAVTGGAQQVKEAATNVKDAAKQSLSESGVSSSNTAAQNARALLMPRDGSATNDGGGINGAQRIAQQTARPMLGANGAGIRRIQQNQPTPAAAAGMTPNGSAVPTSADVQPFRRLNVGPR